MIDQKLLSHVGDLNQLLSVQEGTLSGGFQEGVKFLEVHNGGNLSATILPGRCMDIYQVRYKGKNLNYLAPCGIVAPEFFDAADNQWLRTFFVGMLTTIGLQHIGVPRVSPEGEKQGLHGRIGNTPAENVSWKRDLKDGHLTLEVEGTMREARIFGENLTLRRRISFEYEKDAIVFTDTITNHGFGDRPFVYGLHLNYGYPLLEEGTKILVDSESFVSRTEEAARYADTHLQIEEPGYPYPERCYFHQVAKDEQGRSSYTIFNEKRGIGVHVDYPGADLPYFCEWKMLGKGEYALGMEPLNSCLDGPKIGDPDCPAPVLAPGESKTYRVELQFIDQI